MNRNSYGLRLTLFFALAMTAGGSLAFAQTTLGRLVGSVQDSSGSVLPGATVTLKNQQTSQVDTAVTSETGAFVFPNLPVGRYQVDIALTGFKSKSFTDLIVNVGQEYALTAKLEIGSISETVIVAAGSSLVKTTTPEVTATVLQKQMLDIPLANRDVTNLIKAQPGVQAFINRTNTVINGGRPTWTQVTLDGINIQDNFIRTNSLDFLPNRPNSDNVAEFSITTSVSGADAAGGATSIRMITPSGTNKLTGSVFEFNRDSKYAANSFFNNAANPRVPKPELSRHQFGGRVGGPIQKNKLFFFANYEAMRQTTQTSQNLVIPANQDFYSGVFRYVGTDGVQRSANLMQLTGLSVDPKLRNDFLSLIPEPSKVNNFTVGNSTSERLLNTAGYRFNQTDLNNRDQYTFRGDYTATDAHRFEGVFSYFKETDDRTDLDVVSPDRPLVYTSSDPKRYAFGWRWAATSNLQNELRGGANLAPVAFVTDWDFGDGVLYNTVLNITNPVGGNGTAAAFQSQGRFTDTYQLNENASLLVGSHQLQLGGSWQRNRVNPYNYAGQYPTVSFGFSTAAPASVQLTTSQLPGINATDLASANAMAAWLSGTVTSVARTFQVKDKTSGYVPGIPSNEFYTLDNIAVFFQDNWRWKPNFTLRGGLKWEYYSPLKEDSDLGLLPILNGRSFQQAMLDPTTTVGFVNGNFYNKDLNNFGPTVGFAWDVTKDGRTAVRGGYSLSFVNEESVTVGRAAARGNAGLSSAVSLTQQYTTVSAGTPLPATPTFLSERTLANQVALNPNSPLWGIDPNLKSPFVHQVSVGIQREVGWGTAVEARYVGTFGREIWRGTDYNQIAFSPDFRADFNRARTNGYLAQQAGLTYSPVFNASVPGSQPLTVLPNFGLLTNAAAVSAIQTNQIGALADQYLLQVGAPGAAARAAFLQNSGIYAAQAISNGGFSDYNSLQVEVRRRFRGGFFGQANYTLSDTRTDSAGTAQNRFEAFMDNFRPELNTGRSVSHVTHVLSGSAIYELPFGEGRKWLNTTGILNQIIGGWQVSPVVAWQSGSPISIFSGRGTVNRAGRSNCGDPIGCNTAFSTLSVDQIQKLLGIHRVGDKLYWIDPKVLDPATNRGVGPDTLSNGAGYAGQVFFNPAAGEVGNLPILAFDGPSQFSINLALSKRFRFLSRYSLEFKGEAFNLTNTPSFFVGDMNINSDTFGRITSVNINSRVIQLSARFDF
jgi:hypothetical protein